MTSSTEPEPSRRTRKPRQVTSPTPPTTHPQIETVPISQLSPMTNGKTSRFWCWEPITFHGGGWLRSRPNDVFNYPVPPQSAEGMGSLTGFHPCPKPLAMWRDITTDYTELGATILDPFAGSGTAIVAAEQTRRAAYAIEINPAYVAVILERLKGLGLRPKRG